MKPIHVIRPAIGTALVLLIPLVAMRFSAEVAWGAADFVFAGILLFATGLAYELVAGRGGALAYRAAAGIAVATALLLVWVNGAVGIIGNEGNPANLLYLGVLIVALLGASLARLRPRSMARALFATAAAQLAVPIIALFLWSPQEVSWGVWGVGGVLVLNALFAALWAASAVLFLRSR